MSDSNLRKKLRVEENLENSFANKLSLLPDAPHTPRKLALKQKLRYNFSKLKNYKYRMKQLSQKIKNSKNIKLNLMPAINVLSSIAQTFVLMQFRGPQRKVWSRKEREFAISFFYKSPAAYCFLRRKGIILPSVSTIRRWISSSLFKTGLDENCKEHLKMKCAAMSKQHKKCVIAFDEISIKSCLEYNKKLDLIEGFEDFGPLGRTSKEASHALVFSMRGLFANWKIPIAYFFACNSTPSTILKQLINYVINELQKIGFIPKAIVCDQGSTNRSALKSLGVTKESPFFISNDQTIFSIYDVPHLFKSLRNNLLTGTYKFEDKIISFEPIRKTVEIDRTTKTARALTKISDKHLNPSPFEKMSCCLALQIFSKTVASAIKTCVELNLIDKKAGLDTADFVLTLNNLFDCLNSKRLYDKNPFNCGLSDKNLAVLETLRTSRDMFSSLLKVSKSQPKKSSKTNPILKYSRPPCFDGMVQTINAVLALFENEKQDGNHFILTNRLNQDFLENSFSIIRQRGGWSLNPSAKSFRLAFRIQSITNLLKPSKLSNCEEDSDIQLTQPTHPNLLLASTSKTPDIQNEKLPSTSHSDAFLKDQLLDDNVPESNTNTNTKSSANTLDETDLEDCAISYYAGYLIKKTLDKFQCDVCRSSFQAFDDSILSDRKNIFLLNKNYGCNETIHLLVPSVDMHTMVQRFMLTFNKYFEIYKHQESVGARIKDKIITENIQWLGDNNNSCYEHKSFLISHLVSTNLFKYCKWSRNMLKKNLKQKMKNLKNQ